MPELELIPIPIDASAENVGRVFGDELPVVRDVVAATLAWYAREPRGAPWLGYLAGDPATGRIVGTCSFKTEPRGGVVEIAYYTFSDFEGRGYATAMAKALLGIAAAGGGRERLRADGPGAERLHPGPRKARILPGRRGGRRGDRPGLGLEEAGGAAH